MSKTKNQLIEDLVTTLKRVKKERPDEWSTRLEPYTDMRDGGDGGPWRPHADVSLRELHYKGWNDEDFQDVLELLGETRVLDEGERAERFEHERGVWNKIKKVLGG